MTNFALSRFVKLAATVASVAAFGFFGPSDSLAQSTSAVDPLNLSEEQQVFVKKAEAYLNSFEFLQGRFEQTNGDGSKKDGNFYMRRDGRVRFSYDDPDKTAIVSNGSQIGLVDKRTRTPESPLVPVSLTPLSILAKNPANLQANANVIGMERKASHVTIKLTQKGREDDGSMELFFRLPSFELIGWIVRDANNIPTAMRLHDMKRDIRSNPKLFTIDQYR